MPVLDSHLVAADNLVDNTCVVVALGNFVLEEISCAWILYSVQLGSTNPLWCKHEQWSLVDLFSAFMASVNKKMNFLGS